MNPQSLSEEEQQRVLSEEKIGFKRGSGASSPASKKKNSKAKVRPRKQSDFSLLERIFTFHLMSCILLTSFFHIFSMSALHVLFFVLLKSKSYIILQ